MPRYHLVYVHPNHRHEPVDGEHDVLESACQKAFKLADAAGQRDWRDGSPPPLWVSVYDGIKLELSIQVSRSE